jgi:hypothetical protein
MSRPASSMMRNDERRRVEVQSHHRPTAELAMQLNEQATTKTTALESSLAENLNRINTTRDEALQAIAAEWQNVVLPTLASLQQAGATAKSCSRSGIRNAGILSGCRRIFSTAPCLDRSLSNWKNSAKSPSADEALALPQSGSLQVPLVLTVPQNASVLFETKTSGHEQVIGALNNLVVAPAHQRATGPLGVHDF